MFGRAVRSLLLALGKLLQRLVGGARKEQPPSPQTPAQGETSGSSIAQQEPKPDERNRGDTATALESVSGSPGATEEADPAIKKTPTDGAEAKQKDERVPEAETSQSRSEPAARSRRPHLAGQIREGTQRKAIEYRVQSPRVEVDPFAGEVALIVPSQNVPVEEYRDDPNPSVTISVDGQKTGLSLKDTEQDDQQVTLAELRLPLPRRFKQLSIRFPECLKERVYDFRWQTPAVYVFEPRSEGLPRLLQVFQGNGGINRLPRRELWLLVREGLQLSEDILLEEYSTTAWETYHPCLVDLSQVDALELRDGTDEYVVRMQTRWQLELTGTVLDDSLFDTLPAYTDACSVAIPTGCENDVKISIRSTDRRLEKVLELKPEKNSGRLDLAPLLGQHDCEIQIDAVSVSGPHDWESRKFRWLPSIEAIECPLQNILVPGGNGHGKQRVVVQRRSIDRKLVPTPEIEPYYGGSGSLHYLLDSNCDELKLGIGNSQRVELCFRLPRLRWRLSEGTGDKQWTDRPVPLQREHFSLARSCKLVFGVSGWARIPAGASIALKNREHMLQETRVRRERQADIAILSEFCDTVREHRESLQLVLIWPTDDSKAEHVVAGVEPIGYRCKWCEDQTLDSREEIGEHVIGAHLSEVFQHLTYEQIQKRYAPELPQAIYRCSHCQAYVRSDSTLDNPITAIYHHILEKHRDQSHVFAVVKDINEIRSSVISSLPHVYRCELCEAEIELKIADDDEPLKTHVRQMHLDHLWE